MSSVHFSLFYKIHGRRKDDLYPSLLELSSLHVASKSDLFIAVKSHRLSQIIATSSSPAIWCSNSTSTNGTEKPCFFELPTHNPMRLRASGNSLVLPCHVAHSKSKSFVWSVTFLWSPCDDRSKVQRSNGGIKICRRQSMWRSIRALLLSVQPLWDFSPVSNHN